MLEQVVSVVPEQPEEEMAVAVEVLVLLALALPAVAVAVEVLVVVAGVLPEMPETPEMLGAMLAQTVCPYAAGVTTLLRLVLAGS